MIESGAAPTSPRSEVPCRRVGISSTCYVESRAVMKNFAISTISAAAFVAIALGAAGSAVAAPLTCVDGGSATQCGSPGNVQITTNTPPVQFQPEFPFFGGGGFYRR